MNLCREEQGADESVDTYGCLSRFPQACLEPGWKADPKHRTEPDSPSLRARCQQ